MLIGNIAIITFTVLVFWFCWFSYKQTGTVVRYRILVSIGFWLLAIAIPNVVVLISPLTTLTRGTVLDKDTRRPIAGAIVYAEWRVGGRYRSGDTSSPYKTYATVTNKRGEFRLPRTFKPLSFWLTPLYERYFDSISMKIIGADYYGEVSYHQDANDIQMQLYPVANADEYIRNLSNYPGKLIAAGLNDFEKKFSYRQVRNEAELAVLAKLYEKEGRYSRAIAVYEEIRRREPAAAGTNAIPVAAEIDRLKQMQKQQ